MTINTNVLCTLPIQENDRDCTFQLRSQICGNMNSGITRSITVTPKGNAWLFFISMHNYYYNCD